MAVSVNEVSGVAKRFLVNKGFVSCALQTPYVSCVRDSAEEFANLVLVIPCIMYISSHIYRQMLKNSVKNSTKGTKTATCFDSKESSSGSCKYKSV